MGNEMRMLPRFCVSFCLFLALTFTALPALAGKVGPEFRVNTYTAGYQFLPSIAALGNGGFVVTWSFAQDYSVSGVYGQRYNARGAKVGPEFRVNSVTVDNHTIPSVAALGNGGFVVTWHWYNQDGSVSGVYGQRYSAAGAKVGPEFRVNTYTAGIQSNPSVAGLGNGGFVVTWQSEGQDGFPGYGVYGQRYSAAGARVGPEFRVNTTTVDDQYFPSVAALGDGGFVVTWTGQEGGSNLSGVYGQRYSATGATVGPEFLVNTTTANYQDHPSIAGLSNGGFVVTWQANDQDGFPGYGVYGQRYNP
jgi:hypothetical protein